MKFLKALVIFFIISGTIFTEAEIGSTNFFAPNGRNAFAVAQKVRMHIQVVADSANVIDASLEVPAGTSARDLMDRLFKMAYADVTRRFVTGIAGFEALPKNKKYWKLEIDGKASEVGIAEIKIDKPIQIRWVMTEIE
jgi:hypothetical protein